MIYNYAEGKMITEDAQNLMTAGSQSEVHPFLVQFSRFHLPAVMRLAGQKKIRYSHPGKKYISNEFQGVFESASTESSTSSLARPPPTPVLPGVSQGHEESIRCIPPSSPLLYIARHQLYSVMQWNWEETEGLPAETCFSLEYAVSGVL